MKPPPVTMSIEVFGIPAPQGSKSFKGLRGGKPVLVESSEKTLRPWRNAVRDAAAIHRAVLDLTPFDGPLRLFVAFTFPRPKTVSRKHPDTPPDLSKLIRAVEDSLTDAGAWADDARVCEIWAAKLYVGHPHAMPKPGCTITIGRM